MNRKKAELILVIFIVIALLVNFAFVVPMGSLLVVLTLGCLTTFYFISGLSLFSARPSKDENITTSDIGFKIENIAGLVFSVLTIGFLFKIQSWPQGSFYLNIGLAGLGLLLVLIGLKYARTKIYDAYLLKQITILGLLAIALIALPQTALIDIKYRSQPAYRDALKKSVENPGDTALRNKVLQEQEKMNAGR
jgi:hypothetical protein